jgi:hypothetical protein
MKRYIRKLQFEMVISVLMKLTPIYFQLTRLGMHPAISRKYNSYKCNNKSGIVVQFSYLPHGNIPKIIKPAYAETWQIKKELGYGWTDHTRNP